MEDFEAKMLTMQEAVNLGDLLGPAVGELMLRGVPPGGATMACMVCAVMLHRKVVGNSQPEADAVLVQTFRDLLESLVVAENLVEGPETIQ